MGVLYVSLLLAAIVGSITGTSSCNYYDPTGDVVPSLTPKGDQKLSCLSAKILVLERQTTTTEYDNVICLNGEWFATSCTGKASSLGASVSAGCTPDNGIKWCGIVGLAGKKTPAMSIVDGAQVRMCAADETITVQGLSANLGFTRATCLGNFKWLLFNCEGSIEPVDAPLTAYCEKATSPPTTTISAPTTTAAPPTTTTAPVPLGDLLQFQSPDTLCRGTCDFRFYSGESNNIKNTCAPEGFVWLLGVSCNAGVTRIEGYTPPAGHQSFHCLWLGGTGFEWYTVPSNAKITVPVNPIMRCDGKS